MIVKNHSIDDIKNELKIYKAFVQEDVEKLGACFYFKVHIPKKQAQECLAELKKENTDLKSVQESEAGGAILTFIISRDSYVFSNYK